MSQVAVEKIGGRGTALPAIFDEAKDLFERVRQHAFELFQSRRGGPGSEVDDWLKAEQDLIWNPESDLVEKDGKFEVQMAVPGFEVKDMQVAATPDALIVRAEATHKHEQDKGNVYFCEFGEKELFRRFDLPRPIDVDKVTANLDKGVLHITAAQITAAKEEAKPREKAAAAAA